MKCGDGHQVAAPPTGRRRSCGRMIMKPDAMIEKQGQVIKGNQWN